jgi:RimJ/RimL family protein N-acetyltransferase
MVGPRISGGLVNLRPISREDLPRRVEWLNDEETVRLFTGFPLDRAYDMFDAERWRQTTELDPLTLVWVIETKDGRHIGDVDMHDISRSEGRARLTILIGDRDYWGKGFGTDALTNMLKYAFDDLGLSAINLRVCDFNRRAIRCYEKCGFEQIESTARIPGWQPGDIFMVATKERFAALLSDGKLVHA